MSLPRLKGTLATAAMLVALTACSQNPQFRANVANQAYGSLSELYVLLAKADLGALRSPASFGGEVDSYAQIIGGFEVGRLMVAGRRPGLSRSRAAAFDDLDAAVKRCADQVGRMSDMHRRAGIAPGSETIRTVRASCDAAARLVAASELSSWVFTTVAGNLELPPRFLAGEQAGDQPRELREIGEGRGVGQLADRGEAIALAVDQEGDARGRGGRGVGLAVADEDHRTGRELVGCVVEHPGVGLQHRQAVAAGEPRDRRHQAKGAEQRQRRGVRLLRADREAVAGPGEFRQRRGDPGIEGGAGHGIRGVDRAETQYVGVEVAAGDAAGVAEEGFDQGPDALADEARRDLGRDRRAAKSARSALPEAQSVGLESISVPSRSRTMRAIGHGRRWAGHAAFHLIEQPIAGTCSRGPWPVSAICSIASKSSRRASGFGPRPLSSSRPRYCSCSSELKPKKSGVQAAP